MSRWNQRSFSQVDVQTMDIRTIQQLPPQHILHHTMNPPRPLSRQRNLHVDKSQTQLSTINSLEHLNQRKFNFAFDIGSGLFLNQFYDCKYFELNKNKIIFCR